MFCFGVRVRKASNAFVAGYAEIDVRKDGREETYFVSFGPHGSEIKRLDRSFVPVDGSEDDARWEIIHRQAKPSDIVALLPFSPGWTYSMFLAAITFWEDGRQRGYRDGVRASEEVSRGEE